jgi:hypothetical protein
VRISDRRIPRGGGAPQFILTQEQVVVMGDVGWVTLDENLIGLVARIPVLVRELHPPGCNSLTRTGVRTGVRCRSDYLSSLKSFRSSSLLLAPTM